MGIRDAIATLGILKLAAESRRINRLSTLPLSNGAFKLCVVASILLEGVGAGSRVRVLEMIARTGNEA